MVIDTNHSVGFGDNYDDKNKTSYSLIVAPRQEIDLILCLDASSLDYLNRRKCVSNSKKVKAILKWAKEL